MAAVAKANSSESTGTRSASPLIIPLAQIGSIGSTLPKEFICITLNILKILWAVAICKLTFCTIKVLIHCEKTCQLVSLT